LKETALVFDWLKRSGPPPSVDELVGRGSFRQAVDAFRAQLPDRAATVAERLRLADLLVLADRGDEALPILLGAADELARYGFSDRALEALRRADAIAPGHPDVRDRFAGLARAARARIEAAARPPADATDPYLEKALAGVRALREEADSEMLPLDKGLLGFVRGLGSIAPPAGREALARVLFAEIPHYLFRRVTDGLRRRACPAGSIVVSEGDPGGSIFLIASGSVKILVTGGHGRALEIRRLDAGDFFGEVAALSGNPRTATVVATADCELLEIDREALERLVEARPAARAILEGARDGRARSAEEEAVRSLPEAASPERAAAVLAAHLGGSAWSPRVRLHFAKQMLDAGQEADALAVVASVAEELAAGGHPETGIAILKKVDEARKREPSRAPRPSRVAAEAAFRLWLSSLAHGPDALPHAATPPAVQEEADGHRHR
jgi:CRP-like cAMP-binding protein